MSALSLRSDVRRLSRRDCVKVGSLATVGYGLGGLSLIDAWRGRAAAAGTLAAAKAKACILLWLDGGPSHLETFDPKPEAPAEVRGPFRPMRTPISGIEISELLPRTASIVDKLAIVRSMTSPLGEHGLANHYLMTGYQSSPVLQYPSYGSVVSHLGPPATQLPSHIAIPESRAFGAGFLGSEHDPFVTGGDPSKADFQVRDLDFFPGVDESRIRRRREYLAEFDAMQSAIEARAPAADPAFEQAFRMVTSAQAKAAFDLSAEPASIRARYGPKMFGQSCLLARRLVERGVPFVSVLNVGWDTHTGLVLQLRDGFAGAKVGVGLVPTFDQGFSALIEDLDQRGMLEETLVVAMGEFGRTPKINTGGGRDHWPRVFSVVMAGAGIPGGQVIGASDRVGESPRDRPVTPSDLARTIYTLLGIHPDRELLTSDGRPVSVNQGGKVIRELV